MCGGGECEFDDGLHKSRSVQRRMISLLKTNVLAADEDSMCAV